MSCGEVHCQARELVAQGYTAALVATALLISGSSLYYRNKSREAAKPNEHTMSRWSSRVTRNQPTVIDVWPGSCGRRKD